jgi:SAM-dependent methyltransferase
MSTSTQWQLTLEAAARYQQVIVPAILGPFARALVEWAAPPIGATVLDVGCGTGAAARFAAEQVGPTGHVVGVDVNGGMIAEARSLPVGEGATIEWHEQSAYSLPLPDQNVDVVISAQMVQFLQDRPLGLAEMHRVLTPGGRVAFSVWSDVQENPYFQAQVEACTQYLGPEVAAGLRAGFTLSRADDIYALLATAGFIQIEVINRQLDLPLPDLKEFIPRHISATPLAAGYNAAPASTQQALIEQMTTQLASYATNGRVQVPFRSHFARAIKPEP